jgi:magnesium transporter
MSEEVLEKSEILHGDAIDALANEISQMGPYEASERLENEPDEVIVKVFQSLNPSAAMDILDDFPPPKRRSVIEAAPPEFGQQWSRNQQYEEGTIGRLMEPPVAVFRPETTVKQTVDRLRVLVQITQVTYGYVTDNATKLLGVIVMRDLLFADDSTTLQEIMIKDPFYLDPKMELPDAMKLVLNQHYPVYPVCEEGGRLVGIVRGQMMFEEQAFEISAQPGSMVGVEKEERLATPWPRSLKFRHPWLQLNLLTAFFAGGVVSFFQQTIDQLVILAVFLPILAGQSGNTGCQALAVALRGLTLGDLKPGQEKKLVFKEGLLGFLNGALVGLSASIGMYILARVQNNSSAFLLATVVFCAMIGACVISGIAGALVPLTLKKFGADPATASSIFLTTATDVVSMGMLLGLASWIIL